MRGRGMGNRILAAMALMLAAFAASARGQDVVEIGRRHGATPPRWMLEQLARDPNAFEFRRAWKGELARVRANRARLRALGVAPAALSPKEAARQGVAVTGTYRVPVFTILFANTPAEPYPVADLQDRLYGTSGLTLTTYYDEVSRGLFTLTGAVHGWVRVSRNDTHYEGVDNGLGVQLGDLLVEVLDSVDAAVDFSEYDRDGDGYVDLVAFVHPEEGGECNTSNIWSHRWVIEATRGAPYVTDDSVTIGGVRRPVLVSDYVIQPAYECGRAEPIQIGVFAHEYGHALGLPDLYATNGSNAGIGVWGLMGAGNWNRPSSPAHLSAWSKVELGWMPVVTIDRDTVGLAIEPAETTGPAVRIDLPDSPGEYFLLENRQRIGSDRYLPGTGLLIWHVDSTVIANRRVPNTVQNDAAHKGVDLEEADGEASLDSPDYPGGLGDVFPGSSGNTRFDDSTTPSSAGYGDVASGIAVSNIVEADGKVTVDVSIGTPGQPVVRWGDVNRDGKIDLDDVDMIYRELVGIDTGASMEIADVDGDGNVDTRDALIVHSCIEGVDVSGFRVGEVVPASVARRLVVDRGVPAPNVAPLKKQPITGGHQ